MKRSGGLDPGSRRPPSPPGADDLRTDRNHQTKRVNGSARRSRSRGRRQWTFPPGGTPSQHGSGSPGRSFASRPAGPDPCPTACLPPRGHTVATWVGTAGPSDSLSLGPFDSVRRSRPRPKIACLPPRGHTIATCVGRDRRTESSLQFKLTTFLQKNRGMFPCNGFDCRAARTRRREVSCAVSGEVAQ